MSIKYLNTTFGRLTIIELLPNRQCRCRCECGEFTTVRLPDIINGNTKSCGCLRREVVSQKFRKDLLGQKFGRLQVIEFADSHKGYVRWKCRCDCGKYTVVRGSKLISGHTKSCGCYKSEVTKKAKRTGHGDITGQYWATVKSNAKVRHLDFCITIEDAWSLFIRQNRKCALSNIPLCFSTYDRKIPGNQQTASLDRIDSSLGYAIDNIQWIHKQLNTMKMSLHNDDFTGLCHKISDFQRGVL